MPDPHARTEELTLERLPPLAVASVRPLATPEVRLLPTSCANCRETLRGPYCSNCGQHVADYHHSVWRFVVDFFDSTFCWDNKVFRTLGPLFSQPGFLTREFMQGRRVRYVHPLKLFLFTSAVCLALMQYSQSDMLHFQVPPKSGDKAKREFHVGFQKPFPSASTAPGPQPTTAKTATEDEDANNDTDETADAAADAVRQAVANERAGKRKPGPEASDDLGDKIERAIETRTKDMGRERFSHAVTEGFQHRLSWVALALLPVFALGLRAVYWRKESFYFEHLIFSLHYHTFLFLFWTAYIAVLAVANHLPFHSLLGAVARLSLLLPPIYLFIALRRVYDDATKRTAVKVLVLGSLHLLAIVIGVAAVGAASFFSVK